MMWAATTGCLSLLVAADLAVEAAAVDATQLLRQRRIKKTDVKVRRMPARPTPLPRRPTIERDRRPMLWKASNHA